MDAFNSSQGFVRALKGASDPPKEGGPTKYQIARKGWDDAGFYLPNKAEVIAEWVLSRFLKEKDKQSESNPLLSHDMWKLLHDVLHDPNQNSRAFKTWLTPLLNRIPFPPIVLSFLKLLHGSEESVLLVETACASVEVLWPGASQKLTTDSLLEIFGTYLGAYRPETTHGLLPIGQMLMTSFKGSFYNSSNKRKIYTSFTQNYMHTWLNYITQPSIFDNPNKALAENIYAAGVDVLFCLDVLRQEPIPPLDGSIFSKFTTSAPKNIFQALPLLLGSYVEAIRKYRGALFSQGSGQSQGSSALELQRHAMEMFGSCISVLERSLQPEDAVGIQLSLLRVVEKEQLFSAQNQATTELIMHQLIDKLLNETSVFQKAESLLKAQIESLSSLARIDFALLKPSWRRILSNLLVASPLPFYLEFTGIIIDHYSKIKSLDTYMDSLLATFKDQGSCPPENIEERYRLYLSGPLFQQTHIDQLSRAINSFATGNQAVAISTSVHDLLEDMCNQLDSLSSATESRPHKKRRTNSSPEATPMSPLAVQISLCSRLAEVALSSINFRSLSEETRHEVASILDNIHVRVSQVGKSSLKRLKTVAGPDAWSFSVVAAAALRLRYAFTSSNIPPTNEKSVSHSLLLKTLQRSDLLPELRLELFRSLLSDASSLESEQSASLLETAVIYLEANFGLSGASWAGVTHSLTDDDLGQRNCALGLAHMLLNRWYHDIEATSNAEQLGRLIRTMFNVLGTSAGGNFPAALDQYTFVQQTLQTASFWESWNVRDAFVSYLQEVFSQAPAVQSAAPVVRLLLSIPSDYLPRSIQVDSILFALEVDKLILSASSLDEWMVANLLGTRLFLARTLAQFPNVDQLDLSPEALIQLLSSELPKADIPGLREATFELVDRIWVYVFKRSSSKQQLASSALNVYHNIDVQRVCDREQKILPIGFARMVEVISSEVSISSIPPAVVDELGQIYHGLATQVSKDRDLWKPSSSPAELYRLWHTLLILRKWVDVQDEKLPLVGELLTSEVLRSASDFDDQSIRNSLLPPIFAILLEEVDMVSAPNRLRHLELIVATYLSFASQAASDDLLELNTQISRKFRSLSIADFVHLSNSLSEYMLQATREVDLANATRLVAVLMKEHPHGIMKQLQCLLSQSLQAIVDRLTLVDSSTIMRQQVLEFIAAQTTEHPAVLRPKDMSPFWTVLLKFLSGSQTHDRETSDRQFHLIVNAITALVRLRRDLVVNTLPLLANSLRHLISCFRHVRPQLGSKQTSLIANTQPRWLNTNQPLGVEEAKACARLLQSLATKTVVRSHAATETQKAESLANSFSKHAIWVVKSYSEAMNDPLCIVPLEVRKELRHGLYALLGMINEHDRDALMVTTLDAGGKSTIKALWKEYEKQRYVGKG